jgi:bisphosphoglycerate-independent phosphoglycerate mutase (AlkP superfamily)
MQKSLEDVVMSKEELMRELEMDKLRINHVERERDAYSAAYEASLKNFDKWANSRKNNMVKSIASSFTAMNPLR